MESNLKTSRPKRKFCSAVRLTGLLIGTLALSACAGRAPAPVAVVQPNDRYLDCAAINAEAQANTKRIQELASEEGGKVAQNVAAGVIGLFIWPVWFAMDFQGAAAKEVAALQSRQQYLGTLAEQRCGATPPLPVQSLPAATTTSTPPYVAPVGTSSTAAPAALPTPLMPASTPASGSALGGVLDHGLDAVEAACAEALSAGIANGDVILTVLARQRQPPPVPSITTPHALRLKIEPVADCGRYDSLRKVA